MLVDILSTSTSGGAGIAARRLHDALRREGTASRFWYSHSPDSVGLDASFHEFSQAQLAGNRWQRLWQQIEYRVRRRIQKYQWKWSMHGRPAGLEIFSPAKGPRATPFCPNSPGDILHLHWIARMLDFPSFFASLPDSLPIIWTLHDLFPLTGGCHYASGCTAYTSECGNCPQLGVPGKRDLANKAFHIKSQALLGRQLHVVAPSRWLAREARRSRILESTNSFHHIPYGLDLVQYAPIDRQAARQALGIQPHGLVVGFGAESLENRRKGMPELVEALSRVSMLRPLTGLAFGGGRLADASRSLPPVHSLGYLKTPEQQRLAYNAMDLFVLPSLEENLAQTGLEALACGVPIVGFDTGGTPNFVRPGRTGLLARCGDAQDLARQIHWLLGADDERMEMGRTARKVACEEYDDRLQAQRYKELYRSVLEDAALSAGRQAA